VNESTTPLDDLADDARPRAAGRLRSFGAWMRSDPGAAASLVFLLTLALLALTADWVAPYRPTAQDLGNTLSPPSAAHWLGTDDLGRDTLSRLIHGAPLTLSASLLAVSVALVLGVPVGLAAGYLGGRFDEMVGRLIDTLLSFPAIVLAIAVTGALGIGLTNSMIAVGIVFSPQLARIVRARALVVRNELYVDAARCFGAPTASILWRHVLPNTLQPVIVQVTLLLAGALLAEASLSFLGLGVQEPFTSWGVLIADGKDQMESYPWMLTFPAVFMAVTLFCFNFIGDGLRDALDPKDR